MSEILARLAPSAPRRVFATLVTSMLGLTLLYVAAASPPSELHWTFFLLLLGVVALYGSWKLWSISGHSVELTEEVLRLDDGTEIVRLDDIVRVDRGAFAFKPSNGFVLRLSKRMPRAWMPGLWWRFGKTVGIGGITPGAAGRMMADAIATKLLERDKND